MTTSGVGKGRKPLNPKTAEKLFEKLFDGLREQSPQAFRELKGVLVRWERSDNQAECFERMQEILLPFPDTTKSINDYLEEQTRFAVQPSPTNKIEELFKYLRDNHSEYLTKVLVTLQNTTNQIGFDSNPNDSKVKARFLEIFKDNEEIYNRARSILDDVEAKPRPKEPQPKKQQQPSGYDQDDNRKYQPKPKPQNKRAPAPPPQQEPPRNKTQYATNTGINTEEMLLLMKLDKRSPSFVKLINLYEMCIISKSEILSLLQDANFGQEEGEIVKEIIELRENERRKAINQFKPLNDVDFTNGTRITPSYVEIPWSYPILCKNKPRELKSILNDQWVSVPYGSEHTHFSIRSKNNHEDLLLKSEDQRYEFDLYTRRLKKAQTILWRVIAQADMSDETATRLINSVVCMGVIQTLYKNAQKDQKEELEVCMKSNRVETCTIIRQRMLDQVAALNNIRQVHGLKTWHETAEKNFAKSLDRKTFELKKNEKDFVRQSYFDTELEERLKQLKNKDYKVRYFDENLSLWRLLNTFESFSRTERCESLTAEVPQYNTDQAKNRPLLPLLFMDFGNTPSLEAVYSFLHYHINSMVQGEAEKGRVKKFAAKIFEGILATKLKVMSLREGLTEDVMDNDLRVLNNYQPDSTVLPDTHFIETPVDGMWDQQAKSLPIEMQFEDLKDGRICVKKEVNDELGYLPLKNENQSVVFMTPLIYGIIRTIYTLYERMLKARELLFNFRTTRNFSTQLGEYKFKLFRELLMQYIKAKQNSKYEDFIEQLFGMDSSYLFSTMHKLVETLTKSIQSCLNCQFSGRLLDLGLQSDLKHLIENEYLYLMMANKMSINSTSSDKIIRFHLDNRTMFASINYLTSCYKLVAEEGRDKQAFSKVQQLQRSIENFTTTVQKVNEDLINKYGKKAKRQESVEQSNQMEFMCLDQSLRLFSKLENEDFLFYVGKRSNTSKSIRKELKRRAKAQEYLQQRAKADEALHRSK